VDTLEKQFDAAMMNIYHRAKAEAKYTASIFFNMVSEKGGLATAKQLINSKEPSVGCTQLYFKDRLDLTVEAVVVEERKWHSLFTPEELAKANARLKEYHYQSNTQAQAF